MEYEERRTRYETGDEQAVEFYRERPKIAGGEYGTVKGRLLQNRHTTIMWK